MYFYSFRAGTITLTLGGMKLLKGRQECNFGVCVRDLIVFTRKYIQDKNTIEIIPSNVVNITKS